MKRLASVLALMITFSCLAVVHAARSNQPREKQKHPSFQLGVDVFLKEKVHLLKGKRVGLITNPTGVDQSLNSIVDRFARNPDIRLTALFGPEHGVRGSADAGAYVPFYTDSKTGLPVYSLRHLKC